MLAYAAHRRSLAQRRPAPNAMLVIVAVHVAAIAALMSAKMDLPGPRVIPPMIVDLIPQDNPPPPRDQPRDAPAPQSALDQPVPIVPTPPLDAPRVDPMPLPLPDFGKIIGPSVDPLPKVDRVPTAPARVAARLITPASRLKPPYPAAKLASGEEAMLRLRLTIDSSGRVTVVEAVGPADRTFLEAARRHLIANWRYRPATEDGRALATTTVVTLRFQLEA